MKKSDSSGFSLLELMITITIMGILAASVTYGVGDYIKEKRSEQHIVGLWSQLRTLRAQAIKDNCPYLVAFEPNNGTYKIYRNDSCDYTTANSTVITQGFMSESGEITFGFPDGITSGTSVGGYPVDTTSDNILGDWYHDTSVTPPLGKIIIFHNDAIGTINNGALFLKNTSFPKHGYAIVKPEKSHTIQLWKWNGSKWYEM